MLEASYFLVGFRTFKCSSEAVFIWVWASRNLLKQFKAVYFWESDASFITVCSNRASRSCLIVCFCGWSYEATVAIATGIYDWLSVFWCCVKGRPFPVSLTVLGKPGTKQAFVSFSRTKPKNRWQECAMAKCTKRKVDNRILRQVSDPD